MSEIEEALYQIRNSSPKAKIAYPIKLNDRLAGLQAIVSMGDAPPTPAQRKMFDRLAARLESLVEKYRAVKATYVPLVNTMLIKRGLPQITTDLGRGRPLR